VLVAVDSLAEVATGRRTELEAWPVAGAFLEKPVKDPEGKTAKRPKPEAPKEKAADVLWENLQKKKRL
jgi:hypothetical protein